MFRASKEVVSCENQTASGRGARSVVERALLGRWHVDSNLGEPHELLALARQRRRAARRRWAQRATRLERPTAQQPHPRRRYRPRRAYPPEEPSHGLDPRLPGPCPNGEPPWLGGDPCRRGRERQVTPHVACSDTRRGGSAIDACTAQDAGYRVSQSVRKRGEDYFGWGTTVGHRRQTAFRGPRRVDQQLKPTITASNHEAHGPKAGRGAVQNAAMKRRPVCELPFDAVGAGSQDAAPPLRRSVPAPTMQSRSAFGPNSTPC